MVDFSRCFSQVTNNKLTRRRHHPRYARSLFATLFVEAPLVARVIIFQSI